MRVGVGKWLLLIFLSRAQALDVGEFYYNTFPENFLWGVSTSAYQTEGRWKADGRGPSIWDTFSHKAENTVDGSNGNVASDAFSKYKEDIQLLKKLKIPYYRFSISWSRILPDGTIESKNEKAISHYKNFTKELIDNNIQPLVTLYHWDLPQALQDFGGWQNETIINHFRDFSTLMFDELGHLVKYWITFNDPYSIAWLGYGTGEYAPGIKEPGHAPYIVAHNIIRAHVKVYRTYKNGFFKTQNGSVGISLLADWKEPKTFDDNYAALRALQFQLGLFASPLFYDGNYPEIMTTLVSTKSEQLGIPTRLPVFTEEEIKLNKGAADFLGINHFTTKLVSNRQRSSNMSSYLLDQDVEESFDSSWRGYMDLFYNTSVYDLINDRLPMIHWPYKESDARKTVPVGMRKLLNWIKSTYRNPKVLVTENGYGDCGSIPDAGRIEYHKQYINQVLKAIKHDSCNVQGYFAWSFLDGFEWTSGYTEKYGLVKVDFERDGRDRTPKASANFYSDLIKNNGFVKDWNKVYIHGEVADRDTFVHGYFPKGFAWGTATSAYQIEGGWNADGKGPSIWDTLAHTGRLRNGDTGDLACDSYHKYKEDVQMLRRLGVNHYRFSISWSRVMSDGTIRTVNRKGIDYYNNLINELLANNIQPMVTLYHWDLPQHLQDMGGFLNESIVDYFNDYARLCFSEFGDRVKFWITFNEVFVVSWLGYGIGVMAPSIKSGDTGVYIVTHNIIKSHVRAYHTYDKKFRSTYKGKIGIALDCDWKEPLTDSRMDSYAAERALKFKLGWIANPIYGNGDYPSVMKRKIAEKSKKYGYNGTRLPEFTKQEKIDNKGSADFFGLNHYTTNLIAHKENTDDTTNYEKDQDIDTTYDPCWNRSKSSWLRANPWGIRRLLNWIKVHYKNPPVYITENGVSDNGELEDNSRINFYRQYINEVLKAHKDGCDVRGYMAWSLMDNLEWGDGFTPKFGLYHVDFDDESRPRTPKASADAYSKIIRDNGFPFL